MLRRMAWVPEASDSGPFIERERKALAIYEELEMEAEVADILFSIGQKHPEINEYEPAVVYCERSLKTSQELGENLTIANSFTTLNPANYFRNNINTALDFHRRALKIYSDIGHDENFDLCVSYITQDIMDSGGTSDNLGRTEAVASNLYKYGSVLLTKGDYSSALSFSRHAMGIYEEFRIPAESEAVVELMAEIYRRRN